MPLPVLMRGYSRLLIDLYEPEAYFQRSYRSLIVWETKPSQNPPTLGPSYNLRGMVHSMWIQGVKSNYRGAYWQFLWKLLRNFSANRTKMFIGTQSLMAAHHFVIYARHVANELERECLKIEAQSAAHMEANSPRLSSAG